MPLPTIETTAGDLRERIAVENRTSVDDGFGNTVSGPWAEVFRCAARIKPARGGESIQAARLAGRQPVLITVRSSSNTRTIKPEWRVRDVRRDVIYNVRSIVNPDERDVFLDMECDSGVAT